MEPAAQGIDDTSSIHLADTRTPTRRSDDGERAVFLPGEDSDEDEDEDAKARRSEDRRRMLGNSGAQVSRIDISGGGSDEDGFEMVSASREGSRRAGRSANTLSAKAGSILVRYWPFSDCIRSRIDSPFSENRIGNSEHICCHPAVPRHRIFFDPLRVARPQKAVVAVASRACRAWAWGSGEWYRPVGIKRHCCVSL